MSSRVVVVVFVMQGCGHCHDFAPIVRQAQQRHPSIPVYFVDAAAKDAWSQQLADRHGIEATPTTLLLRNPTGFIKVEGIMSANELEQLMQVAEAHK